MNNPEENPQADFPAPDGPMSNTLSVGKESSEAMDEILGTAKSQAAVLLVCTFASSRELLAGWLAGWPSSELFGFGGVPSQKCAGNRGRLASDVVSSPQAFRSSTLLLLLELLPTRDLLSGRGDHVQRDIIGHLNRCLTLGVY